MILSIFAEGHRGGRNGSVRMRELDDGASTATGLDEQPDSRCCMPRSELSLFSSAPGKPWGYLFLFRLLKPLLCPTRISLNDALNKLAERHVNAAFRFYVLTTLFHTISHSDHFRDTCGSHGQQRAITAKRTFFCVRHAACSTLERTQVGQFAKSLRPSS